jgi:hypothetical protein
MLECNVFLIIEMKGFKDKVEPLMNNPIKRTCMTSIPMDDELSSFLAILLDDDSYSLVRDQDVCIFWIIDILH